MDRKWTSVLTLGLVGALLAGSAWGQSGTTPSSPSDASKSEPAKPEGAKPEGKAESKPDTMKPETKTEKAEKPGKAAQGMARGSEQVKAAQQALKDKGHDPGTIDGVMGPKTQAALKGFQKAEGLKESGRLDTDTMAKLGMEKKTSGAEPSSPAASPPTDAKSPSGEKSKSQ